MGILKRRLARVLSVALVVSSLGPSGKLASAAAVRDDLEWLEKTKIMEMADPASGSDADKDIDQGDFGEDDTGNENLEIVGEEERIDEIKRNAETSGTCGENLTWSLVDGVLTISGTGEMESYDLNQNVTAPWYEDRDLVTNVIIEEGVASIGGGGVLLL